MEENRWTLPLDNEPQGSKREPQTRLYLMKTLNKYLQSKGTKVPEMFILEMQTISGSSFFVFFFFGRARAPHLEFQTSAVSRVADSRRLRSYSGCLKVPSLEPSGPC